MIAIKKRLVKRETSGQAGVNNTIAIIIKTINNQLRSNKVLQKSMKLQNAKNILQILLKFNCFDWKWKKCKKSDF